VIRRILATLRDAWRIVWTDDRLSEWDGGPTW